MASVVFPFAIKNGRVAVTDVDGHEVRSKVMFCLGTEIGERVMRPQWGIDILGTAYSVGEDMDAAVPEAIENAFKKHFPNIRLIDVELVPKENDPTYYSVTVRFGAIDEDIDEVVRLDMPVTERT